MPNYRDPKNSLKSKYAIPTAAVYTWQKKLNLRKSYLK